MLDKNKLRLIAEKLGVEIEFNSSPGVYDKSDNTLTTYKELFSNFFQLGNGIELENITNLQELKLGYNNNRYGTSKNDTESGYYKTKRVSAKFSSNNIGAGAA